MLNMLDPVAQRFRGLKYVGKSTYSHNVMNIMTICLSKASTKDSLVEIVHLLDTNLISKMHIIDTRLIRIILLMTIDNIKKQTDNKLYVIITDRYK
jgi:hypothetical protein